MRGTVKRCPTPGPIPRQDPPSRWPGRRCSRSGSSWPRRSPRCSSPISAPGCSRSRTRRPPTRFGPRDRSSMGPSRDGHSSPFARLNRNKESVALDLKAPAGRAAFLRLAATADAIVENLRPGAMRGLGLDFPAVQRGQPGCRLRLGIRLGAGRAARRPARAGHHGPGPRRADEHHRHSGRRTGQGGRPDLRPGVRPLPRPRRGGRVAGAGPIGAGPVPRRLAVRVGGVCRCGRPAGTSPPAKSGVPSARRTRTRPRTRRCAARMAG